MKTAMMESIKEKINELESLVGKIRSVLEQLRLVELMKESIPVIEQEIRGFGTAPVHKKVLLLGVEAYRTELEKELSELTNISKSKMSAYLTEKQPPQQTCCCADRPMECTVHPV